MKYRKHQGFIFIAIIVTILFACIHTNSAHTVDREDMIELSSNVIYLTVKVEDLYRTKSVPPEATDEMILNMATEKALDLKKFFKGYMVTFKSELGHAVVLVCTKDGQQALIEDTACSMGPDKKPWESSQPIPCKFTINKQYIEKTCGVRR